MKLNLNFSEMTFKGVMKTTLGLIGSGVALMLTVCGIYYGIKALSEENYSYTIFKSKAELNYYSTKDDLIKCLDEYIHLVAAESAMNGLAFLDKCDKYNVDVRFAMAQAQVEGAFSTKGIAAKTHSAFNVHAYDGRSAADMINKGHGYRHPDESIEPYLKLLTTTYLVDGKTEMDMLDKFVNRDGRRYASSPTYEQALRTAYQQLTENTNVSILYAEYQKYKMICGK